MEKKGSLSVGNRSKHSSKMEARVLANRSTIKEIIFKRKQMKKSFLKNAKKNAAMEQEKKELTEYMDKAIDRQMKGIKWMFYKISKIYKPFIFSICLGGISVYFSHCYKQCCEPTDTNPPTYWERLMKLDFY